MRKFKVGDRTVVKTVADMERDRENFKEGEYGLRDVNTGCNFISDMHKFCGKEYEVSKYDGVYIKLRGIEWSFTEAMLLTPEEAKNKPPKQEIHITTEETTTHAILKENGQVVNRSKTMCNPDDTYDFETGVRLAVDRLFGKEVKETQQDAVIFKARCIDASGNGDYTEGKVYECINGVVKMDDGFVISNGTKLFNSFKEFKSFSSAKWEPVTDEQPEVREVKRHAEVGEYIKIVNIWKGEHRYANGDIFRVSSYFTDDKVFGIPDGFHLECAIHDQEYVVLENYQPPITKDTEPQQPKLYTEEEVIELIRKAMKGE